ncbi:MAG: tetratricopeptide repeat protein, partial [Myxococcales bacterium]|nr:tetratricopeptide repeat protein [Myxococcales bacterium]
ARLLAREEASFWNDETREQVRESFVATGVSYADAVYDRVAKDLDGYVSRWTEQANQVCIQRASSSTDDRARADKSERCLHRMRDEFNELMETLVRIDASALQRVVMKPTRLHAPELCSDSRHLDFWAPPPASERDALDQLTELFSLAQGIGEATALDPDARGEALDRAIERAKELDARPILAEALLQRGIREERARDIETAERTIIQSINTAASVGDTGTQLRALIYLIHTIGRGGKARLEEALSRLDDALALIEATGRHALLRSELWTAAGNAATFGGEPERGLEFHRSAYDQLLSELGPEHPLTLKSGLNIGNTLIKAERAVEAEKHLLELLPRATTTWGAEHESTARVHENLARAYLLQKQHPAAERAFRRVLAIKREHYGVDHQSVATTEYNLAVTLREHDPENEEALVLLRHGLEVRERVQKDTLNVAEWLIQVAWAELDLGNGADARAPLERAMSIYERRGASAEQLARGWLLLARAVVTEDPAHARILIGRVQDKLEGDEIVSPDARGLLEKDFAAFVERHEPVHASP